MKIHLISFSNRNFGLRLISSYLKQNKFDVNFIIVDPVGKKSSMQDKAESAITVAAGKMVKGTNNPRRTVLK